LLIPEFAQADELGHHSRWQTIPDHHRDRQRHVVPKRGSELVGGTTKMILAHPQALPAQSIDLTN
jgi:hypothetical protein